MPLTRRVVVLTGVTAVLGLLLGGVLLASGLGVRRVSSGSMTPTFPVGSWVLVRAGTPPSVRDLHRGDVVVFHYPFGSDRWAIKRVAGVPGDQVDGRVVGKDSVYLLGDNADGSIDSRHFGSVPQDQLVGRVLLELPVAPYLLIGAALAGVALVSVAVRPRRLRPS